MSWSITAAGEAAKVATTFAQKVDDRIAAGLPDFGVAILRAHQQVVQTVCEAAQTSDTVIIAESNGHLEKSSGGNGDLRVRKVW